MKSRRKPLSSIVLWIVVLAGFGGYAIQIPGCSSDKSANRGNPVDPPDLTDDSKRIGEASQDVFDISDSVGNSAEAISGETQNIRTLTNDDPTIEPSVSNIENEAESLRDDSEQLAVIGDRLKRTQQDLESEQSKVDELENAAEASRGEIDRLQKENDELKSEASQLFKSKMAWIGVVSVFGIGASIILAFVTRSMTATMVAIGFVVTLGVSIAVSLYMSYIAWITIVVAGVSVLAVLGYLGWGIFSQNKTMDELIQTGEVTKNYLSQEARDHIFGRGAEPGIADQVQSKHTKDRVKQVRYYNDRKRGFALSPSTPQVSRLPVTNEIRTYSVEGQSQSSF